MVKKFKDARHTLTDLIKWVIVDLESLMQKINEEKIIIKTDNRTTCWEKDGIIYCPENFNPDGSSSFIPFDIPLLHKKWGNEIIFKSHGYDL